MEAFFLAEPSGAERGDNVHCWLRHGKPMGAGQVDRSPRGNVIQPRTGRAKY